MSMDFKLSDLNDIDFEDVSKWPLAVKAIAILLICVAVLAAGLWFDSRSQLDKLAKAEKQEQKLKQEFKTKYNKAVNLEDYKRQMVWMKKSFGAMLRQLPSETEVAELLTDISRTGISNGLEFELFKPQTETPIEFYAELPIQIKVVGSYHEFGNFVSAVAALPRIVTLHNLTISKKNKNSKNNKSDLLIMEATAKTYRYLDEDQQ